MEKKADRKRGRRSTRRYSAEFREKVVRLHLEEGYTLKSLGEEFGCAKDTIHGWVKVYRAAIRTEEYPPLSGRGVAGERRAPEDESQPPGKAPEDALKKAVAGKIVELKTAEPTHGIRRISDILKRFFLLKASPEKVRTVLREAKLMGPPTPARKQRNDPKPRFFERATPNQMWQSDICTFRLAGQNAYLIGFMDDYSRYIVGLGLYRSQPAENVLEVLKTAVGEYGVPKEMLTDNGRQYTNWRGTTRFEQYLSQERVKHIRSSPHHPMTLGKIERFWKTAQQEFLFRTQFDSFESARERLALWVKYYNYKRPNQGIDGLCPADRFFEVQSELRRTLEKGVHENVLELALRGRPKSPFYMVGRLGGQNVAIRAEKGKIRMHIDEAGVLEGKVLEYDMNAEESNNGVDTGSGSGAGEAEASEAGAGGAGEGQGCAVDLDGEEEGERHLPGDGGEPDTSGPLGGAGVGGDAGGPGPAEVEEGAGEAPVGLSSGAPAGEADAEKAGGEAGGTAAEVPGGACEAGGQDSPDTGQVEGEEGQGEGAQTGLNLEGMDGKEGWHEGAEGEGAFRQETRRGHYQGHRRPLHCLRRRR
jgi:transposase InsO family protein